VKLSVEDSDIELAKSISQPTMDLDGVALDLVLRFLPQQSCARPTTLFDVPSVILADMSCFKSTLSLVIGLGVVCMASIVKLPQVAAIVNAQSAVGLSVATLLLETFGYVYNLAAHIRMGYPLSTYGDFGMLIVQNAALILLVNYYSGRLSAGFAMVVSYAAVLLWMSSSLFPLSVLKFMTLGNVALTIASRVPQIAQNYRNKSTGALSAITCVGVFCGSIARVFTTLQDVDSINILLGYITSASLNGIIATQVMYYRKPVAKKAD
jgi:mannose-P-dolichol utilization defect 1